MRAPGAVNRFLTDPFTAYSSALAIVRATQPAAMDAMPRIPPRLPAPPRRGLETLDRAGRAGGAAATR